MRARCRLLRRQVIDLQKVRVADEKPHVFVVDTKAACHILQRGV
jgi:hypothetical protein